MTPQDQNIPCICRNAECQIPFGLCHCGCGKKSLLASRSAARHYQKKGMPHRFVMGHQKRHPRINFDDAAPFKIDGIYCKLIPLTQGQYAIVKQADYESLSQSHWHAWFNPYTRSFYAKRTVWLGKGRKHELGMHRQLLGLTLGDKDLGDHINGNTLDNRSGGLLERGNLRRASSGQNGANSKKSRSNKSGYKGVYWDKRIKRWVARIQVNWTVRILGYFDGPEEAYGCYCAAAKKYFGEFARLA